MFRCKSDETIHFIITQVQIQTLLQRVSARYSGYNLSDPAYGLHVLQHSNNVNSESTG